MLNEIQVDFINRVLGRQDFQDLYNFREESVENLDMAAEDIVNYMAEYTELDMPDDDGMMGVFLDRANSGGNVGEEVRDFLIELMKRVYRLSKYEAEPSTEEVEDIEDIEPEISDIDFESIPDIDMDEIEAEEEMLGERYSFPGYDAKFFERVGMKNSPVIFETKEFEEDPGRKEYYEGILKNISLKRVMEGSKDPAVLKEAEKVINGWIKKGPNKPLFESISFDVVKEVTPKHVRILTEMILDRARNGLHTYYASQKNNK